MKITVAASLSMISSYRSDKALNSSKPALQHAEKVLRLQSAHKYSLPKRGDEDTPVGLCRLSLVHLKIQKR
jgi:hypothetical protein